MKNWDQKGKIIFLIQSSWLGEVQYIRSEQWKYL
jgi:hypothetical protein